MKVQELIDHLSEKHPDAEVEIEVEVHSDEEDCLVTFAPIAEAMEHYGAHTVGLAVDLYSHELVDLRPADPVDSSRGRPPRCVGREGSESACSAQSPFRKLTAGELSAFLDGQDPTADFILAFRDTDKRVLWRRASELGFTLFSDPWFDPEGVTPLPVVEIDITGELEVTGL